MKRSIAAVLAAGAVLLAAGCSGVEKDATYETAEDLRDAMVASGYDCPDWNDDDTAGDFDAGRCLTDHRDMIRVYSDQSAREADTEGAILGAQLSMVSSRTDQAVLVGTNWIIAGPEDQVRALQESLGGYVPDISDVRFPV